MHFESQRQSASSSASSAQQHQQQYQQQQYQQQQQQQSASFNALESLQRSMASASSAQQCGAETMQSLAKQSGIIHHDTLMHECFLFLYHIYYILNCPA
jgi:ATP-dependent 26S proteasome regulatory subunit